MEICHYTDTQIKLSYIYWRFHKYCMWNKKWYYFSANTLFTPCICVPENYFSYFSTKTYVEGTQKNRLDETVLLITQNMFKLMGKKIITILCLNLLLNWPYENKDTITSLRRFF